MTDPTATPTAPLPAAMPALVWRATPEATEAHLFATEGPGWMTSRCIDRVRFSFRMQRVDDDFPRHAGCLDAIAHPVTETELAEAWGK
jgi:hypothetical protein